MPEPDHGREGVARKYVLGLDMLTVPSYWSAGTYSHKKPLPGVLARNPVLPHRTGPTALAQAVALLTGRRVGIPAIASATGMVAQAIRYLPGVGVELVAKLDPASMLGQCLAAVDAGGVVLVQWQPLAWKNEPPEPSRWMLVVGLERPWPRPGQETLSGISASALLVLDATIPRVWGSGHNMHLVPGWTARTMEGGLQRGLVIAAGALVPKGPPSGGDAA